MENKNITLKVLMIAIIVALGIKTYLLCVEQEEVTNQVERYVQNTVYRKDSTKSIADYQNTYQNPEIVGNLLVPGTDFQVLVTQTTDNSFYLQHDIKKEFSELGNPFLDYRNHLEDKKLLIYGHNSQTVSTEFQFLENYLSAQFYEQYPVFIWQTEDALDVYSFAGVLIVDSNFWHMQLEFTEEKWLHHLNWLQNQFLYSTEVSLDIDDQLLILQTCYYEPKDSYLLIVTKKETEI